MRRDTVPSNCTITTFNGKPSRFNSCFLSFSVAASHALHHQHISPLYMPIRIHSLASKRVSISSEDSTPGSRSRLR